MPKNQDSGFILIVDDNPTNLSVLSEALSSEGFRFRVAMDGESTLTLVERNQPELILLDVQMPGIDGFEVCSRLKEKPLTEKIPIIFATALSDTESKTKGFALGAVDYIPKPFDREEVLARVRVHLQLKHLRESLEDQVRDRTAALQQAQVQLVQQEKLSSLGEMVAGIAHELNNPITFLSSNLEPLKDYVVSVKDILHLYEQDCPKPSTELEKAIDDLDLDFVLEDMEKIIESFTLGVKRIKNISESLRIFSRADSETKIEADLHACLDSTLTILQHRIKGSGDRDPIEIIKAYNSLPPVLCYPGPLNQVFMNILANGIDALDESLLQGKLDNPKLEIQTKLLPSDKIEIQITDNGLGIPESIQTRLFEPLFTTKPVGKGTGLGLAIAHQIVVEKHQGQLSVESHLGKGTTFTIEIPIQG
ncbi:MULTISPECIES: sensor histidine kinase [unclassified Roseofilum]|uniref:sensor histidine kinase n=1 Tax=unclassified Roseofilum TaxID=2620099 RepID=UPI000E8DC627|nr:MULTISPECIES: response regulator [unclassified Roseofilum]MBP0008926.1 response regulator [Roseofilum sp. Belize Diploria]MBP0032591.1 response regulator [Roseofilum sp. Belize BBD 4]HBR00328.1 hybrid sensor histidine kinase/response regulator [Cyanobacteria bacterium UBA11691]